MSNAQVRNVDPAIHERLRERAAAADMPLGEYVLELIRKVLRTPSRNEWLATARALPHIDSDLEVVDALDAGRGERDR